MEQGVNENLQIYVGKSKEKTVEKIVLISMLVSTVVTLFLYFSTFRIMFSIEIIGHSKIVYSLLIVNAVATFYVSMLADKLTKSVNRPRSTYSLQLQ